MGLQLENLVLRNLPDVLDKLGVPSASVISASPYFQNATRRQQACQIDLLVHTKSALFVCEVRSTREIGAEVVSEVAEKIRRLTYPRHLSTRPVLICLGDLAPQVEDECFFDRMLSLESLL